MGTAWRGLSPAGKVDAIKSVWEDGMSARDIAVALWKRQGWAVTRNAVIGLYRRNAGLLQDYPLRGVVGVQKSRKRAPRKPNSKPTTDYRPPRKHHRHSGRANQLQKPAQRAYLPPLPITLTSDEYDATALMLPLVELTDRTCRFPFGDPKEEGFGFCGHETEPGSSWCAHHRRRVEGIGTASERTAIRDARKQAA